MKYFCILFLALLSDISFSQDVEWIETEGEITEIKISRRRTRETAIVKFKLQDGTEQFGQAELFRIPFIGSTNAVGDIITVNYDKSNPVILKTGFGKLLTNYGMYVLILLGIIFSIKPLLKHRKNASQNE